MERLLVIVVVGVAHGEEEEGGVELVGVEAVATAREDRRGDVYGGDEEVERAEEETG